MSTTQPLIALVAQSERQRDLALADQSKAQHERDTSAAKAEELRSYRSEYEARWSAQFCREGQIELVRCYHGFMARLTQALEHQQRAADAAAARLDQATASVRECELQVAAVHKILERRLDERRGDARRHEQKMDDELAARMAWQARRAGGPSNAA